MQKVEIHIVQLDGERKRVLRVLEVEASDAQRIGTELVTEILVARPNAEVYWDYTEKFQRHTDESGKRTQGREAGAQEKSLLHQ